MDTFYKTQGRSRTEEAPNANSGFPSKYCGVSLLTSKSQICCMTTAAHPAAAPSNALAPPNAGNVLQHLDKAGPKACIHVAVDDGIVATVRHGEPVTNEPKVG